MGCSWPLSSSDGVRLRESISTQGQQVLYFGKVIHVTESISRNINRKHLTEACDMFYPVEKSSIIGL